MLPYIRIFIVGHIIVPLLVVVEAACQPELRMQTAFWPPAALSLTLLFLPVMKGSVIGLVWHLKLKDDEKR